MKFKTLENLSYLQYHPVISYSDEITDEGEIRRLLRQFNYFPKFISSILPILFVLDYATGKYMFISKGDDVFGYNSKDFLSCGPAVILDGMNRNFFKSFNEKIFPATIDLLKSTPQEEHKNLTFSFNFKFKKPKGNWIDIYQKNMFITSKETGIPLYGIGLGIDITGLKKDNVITRTIEKKEIINGNICNTIIDAVNYFPYEEDKLITKQEKIVLQWLVDGLSSKMIADKLCISENTVVNHRKNMLKKTNTSNVAQLVAYAIRIQII